MKPKNFSKKEEEYSYVDKSSGKVFKFSRKSDEEVISIKLEPDQKSLDSLDVPSAVSIKEANLIRGFAVVKSTDSDAIEIPSESLESVENILNHIPVLIDDEGLTRYFLPDELTVQFKEGISDETANEIITSLGSSILIKQRTKGYFTILVPEGKGLFETIQEVLEFEEVEFAEPSEFGLDDELEYTPNDQDFKKLWGLSNIGQSVNGIIGTIGADINAKKAWDITKGISEVIIAVIDTGADLDHPDLTDNILERGNEDWDFADNDDVPEDESNKTHGTHVSGTVGGVDNSIGVIGVAPRCKIMPLRINLKRGMNANRADAINYVAKQAKKFPGNRYVINCSWRMNGHHTGVLNAIKKAITNNAIVVFAAGNDNSDIHEKSQYPAIYPQVIAVAATNQFDKKASFSNYGIEVDVSAPGENIWSTMGNGSYGYKNGTSMAAPHVAGVAALVWASNMNLTNIQVRQIIEGTCDNIDNLNPNYLGKLGKGRINAWKALRSAILM